MKNRMKHRKTPKIVAGLTALFGGIATLPAAVLVSVDMDPLTVGIQDTLTVALNQIFSIDLVVTADADGLSSYGISALFDNAELTLNGVPDAAAATELLPSGFTFNFGPGVSSASQALGQVYTFEAATFGSGPVSSSFVIGSISFKATAPLTDGLLDVTPGLFNVGVDGIFDNASGDKGPTATFAGGKVNVVPEPASAALLAGGMAMMLGLRRRRSA